MHRVVSPPAQVFQPSPTNPHVELSHPNQYVVPEDVSANATEAGRKEEGAKTLAAAKTTAPITIACGIEITFIKFSKRVRLVTR